MWLVIFYSFVQISQTSKPPEDKKSIVLRMRRHKSTAISFFLYTDDATRVLSEVLKLLQLIRHAGGLMDLWALLGQTLIRFQTSFAF